MKKNIKLILTFFLFTFIMIIPSVRSYAANYSITIKRSGQELYFKSDNKLALIYWSGTDDANVFSFSPIDSNWGIGSAYNYGGHTIYYKLLSQSELDPQCDYYIAPNLNRDDIVLQVLQGNLSNVEVVSHEKYDSGVGAIKNVKRNILYDRSSDNLKAFYRFSFDSKTTLGYNLKTPGTKIRVYETQTYYKRKTNEVVYEGNKVLIGDFDATKLYFDFDATTNYEKVAAETTVESVPSALDVVFKQLVRDDNLYLQVITPDSKRGYFLRISGSSDAERFEASPQDVFDESGNVVSDDNGGYHKDDTYGGSGETYNGDLDSANDNANKNAEEQQKAQNGSMDVESAKGTLKDMLDMVNYIPFMIAKLFSYLPAWCLNMLALFFTASVVLAVYKLFRG